MKGCVFEVIVYCFNIWLGNLGYGENMEEIKFFEYIKVFFEVNGISCFEDIIIIRQVDGEVLCQRIYNCVGYYDFKDKVYLVFLIMFKKEMCIGMNEVSVKKVLIKYGWIKGFIEGDKKLYVKKFSNILFDGICLCMMYFSVEVM